MTRPLATIAAAATLSLSGVAAGAPSSGTARPPAEPRPGRTDSPEAARGTYRLRGSARVDAGPVLSRSVEARADAVLRPGERPRAVRARLASQGHVCELAATLEEGGALAFEAGQRCAFDLRDPEARGHVEARLRSGRGTVRGGRLALDLSWDLSGAVSVQTARQVEVLGRTVELPAAWTPELPVRGEARIVAEGERDESRGAGR